MGARAAPDRRRVGAHWYESVERSTGFGPPRERTEPVPERYRAIHEECLEHYERLAEHRL